VLDNARRAKVPRVSKRVHEVQQAHDVALL
jgi:hypothetical protein